MIVFWKVSRIFVSIVTAFDYVQKWMQFNSVGLDGLDTLWDVVDTSVQCNQRRCECEYWIYRAQYHEASLLR